MYVCSQVFLPVGGRADAFNRQMTDAVSVLASRGLEVGVKATVLGSSTLEVFIISLFESMAEYGASLVTLRASAQWRQMFMDLGPSDAVIPVDSFMLRLLEGYDDSRVYSEAAIASAVWKPVPGRIADLKLGMGIAKAMHERHGASRIRAHETIGGRWTGCLVYNASYDSLEAMGTAVDAGHDEDKAFFEEAGKDPVAELVARIMLDNPVIIQG